MSSFDEPAESPGLLDKLDAIAPIREFDAFPKVQQSYTKSTSFGGAATIIVILLSFLLILNDLGEYVWGWPDTEFSVDHRMKSTLDINLDMVINMPCHFLTIDVRDSMGDRLHLTSGFRRDGTIFDVGQAHILQSHGDQQSIREVVTSARKKSGGLFASWKGPGTPKYKPTYNYVPDGSACRLYGSAQVKRVTGNLHITTLGHGYSSFEHTEHKVMNLSHIITEFSFGPYFPDISQPLDNSLEIADEHFTVFQYFLTVVPTVYHAARSTPLRTNQYSATNYRRVIEHGRGTPGIFFKYDVEPLQMSIYQRTTGLLQFLIRIAGVIGGVWVCAAWAVKISMKAVTVTGVVDDDDDTIVKEVKKKGSFARRWAGGEIRSRTGSEASRWTIDTANGAHSPYSASPYGGTPYSGTPAYVGTPSIAVNGYPSTPNSTGSYAFPSPANIPLPGTPNGLPPSPFPGQRPPPTRLDTTSSINSADLYRQYSPSPYSPGATSPLGNGNGIHHQPPPPMRQGSHLNPANTKDVKKAD